MGVVLCWDRDLPPYHFGVVTFPFGLEHDPWHPDWRWHLAYEDYDQEGGKPNPSHALSQEKKKKNLCWSWRQVEGLDPLSTSIPWKRHPNDYVLRLFFLNFVGSWFWSREKSTICARLVQALVDLSRIKTYDWGGLFFGYNLHSLRQFAHGETNSFYSFWQFTIYWAYKYCCSMRSRHVALYENAFPRARRWDIYFLKSTNAVSLLKCHSKVDGLRETNLIFEPYPHLLLNWAEVQKALRRTAMRYWFQTIHGWELFLEKHSLRQFDGVRSIPANPPPNISLTKFSLDLTLYNSRTCRGLFRKDLKYDDGSTRHPSGLC